MSGRWLAMGVVAAIAAAGLVRRGSRSVVYTGYNCPVTPQDVINWTIGDWWYPTPAEEIEWQQFVAEVDLDPDLVAQIDYLPWKPDWEPWSEFLSRSDAPYEGFFRATLPSGRRVWVWQASGVEHFFTQGGEFDPEHEDALIEAITDELEALSQEREVVLSDTLEALTRRRRS